jgi:hypothetical protein
VPSAKVTGPSPDDIHVIQALKLSHKSDPWFELALHLFTRSALLTTVITTSVNEPMSERGRQRQRLPDGLSAHGRDLAVVVRF